ncbi:uncharacterized protein ACA1_251530 [Acanthamoeba castellanii str. Neff]|uniref:PIN domain-containing protein n=1 Tax=Acanthamoeba castellanii (strain ATCC 30010 / Neff) TaxID=1257118 RepID=L8HCZ4_ACACF|nr:uncharacterized protein ACA1_251530 [Acanthamoeba castellanii str. Neff]ELR22271.1 hypothetical protein ACA1_251530 [Acanthamoeba castellanii str. Neff]
MGKIKKTRKFAEVKRMISPKDARVKHKEGGAQKKQDEEKEKKKDAELVKTVPKASSALFFKYNAQLGPPYYVLLDTNFINFSIQNKLEIVSAMMDCLFAKCIPCITDCVMAELEKLGKKFRVALSHKGTYADDCLVSRVNMHKVSEGKKTRLAHFCEQPCLNHCYIVATCDKDLKRRIRKIPGVPIMYISQHKYSIERMPEALGAPA